MPISSSQHRIATQRFQNQYYKKAYNPSVNLTKSSHNYSETDNNIRNFSARIASTYNTPESLEVPLIQPYRPQNFTQAAIPFLLLLSQIKNISEPSLNSTNPLSMVQREGLLASSLNHSFSLESNHTFNETPRVKRSAIEFEAFHKERRRHCFKRDASYSMSNNRVHVSGMNIVEHGLNDLGCHRLYNYKFFIRTSYNALKLLNSVLRQLRDKDDNKFDEYLKQCGFIDTHRAREELKPIYKNIKMTIKSFLRDNRDGGLLWKW